MIRESSLGTGNRGHSKAGAYPALQTLARNSNALWQLISSWAYVAKKQKWASIAGRPFCCSKIENRNLENRLSLRGFGLQRVLGDLDQLSKRRVVGGRDVSEDFAVEGDFGGFEAFHEAAVGGAGGASGGVNANLPQRAEVTLLGAAIAEGILPAMIDGVGGIAIKFRAAHPEAFGGPDHSSAALA